MNYLTPEKASSKKVYLFALFTISCALLATEILYTRIFSVLYHLSFMFIVISIAMLGIGIAGTLIYVAPRTFNKKRKDLLFFLFGLLFCLSIPFSLGINFWSATIPYVQRLTPSLGAIIISFLITTLPFFFGGVYLTLNISFFKEDIGKFYFADLLGAGVGCLISIFIINEFGGISGLLILPSLAAVGIGAIAIKNRNVIEIFSTVGVIFLSFFLAYFGENNRYFNMTHSKGRLLSQDLLFAKWTPIGRISINPRGIIRIDEGVITPIPRIKGSNDLEALKASVMTMPYNLKQEGDVLIVGPGGGIDILRAYIGKSKKVTGVEINPAIIEAMTGPLKEFSRNIYFFPGVKVFCKEGRNFISHTKEKFDVVQISFIDTYTATATGSSALSENFLYTREACDEYWEHLKDPGILTISRWGGELFGACEIERATVLAVDLLLRKGIKEPWKHIVVLRNPIPENIPKGPGYMSLEKSDHMAALLMKKTPFTNEELKKIKDYVAKFKHRILFIPGEELGLLELKKLVKCSSLEELRGKLKKFYEENYFDLTPPTDDTPFFFSMLKPLDINKMEKKFPEWRKDRGKRAKYGSILMVRNLIIILFFLALAFILLPLFIRFDKKMNFLSGLPILVYFSLIGLGFMFIEISAINRFSLLLGHPTYALTIVLFSVLIFAGLGSLAFSKLSIKKPEIIPFVISIVSFFSWLIHPIIIKYFLHSSFNIRAIITILNIAPLCFPMGMALPLGVKLLSKKLGDIIPWAFALNGIFSVTGSTLALFFNFQGGYKLTFLMGVFCYMVAIVVLSIFKKTEKMIGYKREALKMRRNLKRA